MILPTKRIGQERSLLTLGAEVLQLLGEPKTASRLWNELRQIKIAKFGAPIITYDWFVLALDLLYTINAIDLERGRIRRIDG